MAEEVVEPTAEEEETVTEEVAQQDISAEEYNRLQAEYTRMSQEKSRLERSYDLLTSNLPQQQQQPVAPEPELADDDIITVAEMKRREQKLMQQMQMQGQFDRTEMDFWIQNPELKPYEKYVKAHYLEDTDPNLPFEVRLKEAGRLAKETLAPIISKGKKASAAEKAAVSGLAGGSKVTAPAPADDTGDESLDDYLKNRQSMRHKSVPRI